jgi:hypothetical protein
MTCMKRAEPAGSGDRGSNLKWKSENFVRCCSFVSQSAHCSKTVSTNFFVDLADLYAAHGLIPVVHCSKDGFETTEFPEGH